MRFRITYSGPLKAAGNNNPRLREKAEVRAHIAPQLRELRNHHPAFGGLGLVYQEDGRTFLSGPSTRATVSRPVLVQGGQRGPAQMIADPMFAASHPFMPLVRRSLDLTCSIDILFLRKDRPGRLLGQTGDLDNRLKTLFDGLRMPTPNEVERLSDLYPGPSGEFNPVHCLLENDDLITDFTVRTDRLLSDPEGPRSNVLLIMEVVVRIARLNTYNVGFLGD